MAIIKFMIICTFATVIVVSATPKCERRSLGLSYNGAIVLGGSSGLVPGLALASPVASTAASSVAVIGPSVESTAVVGPSVESTTVDGDASGGTLIAGLARVISTGIRGVRTIATAHGFLAVY